MNLIDNRTLAIVTVEGSQIGTKLRIPHTTKLGKEVNKKDPYKGLFVNTSFVRGF